MDAAAPPRRATARRLLLGLVCAALGLTLIGWVTGYVRLLHAERRFGSIVGPGQPGGEPDMWVFRARSVHLGQGRGAVGVALSEYRSLAPTRAGLDDWSAWPRWSMDVHSPEALGPAPLFRFKALDDFAVLGVGTTSAIRSGEGTRVAFAHNWVLATLLALLALWLWLPQHRRARRLAAGQCVRCSYDLRATPPGSPCPECGRAAPRP